MILENLTEIKPKHLLDVACLYGEFTAKLAEHCEKVTAIDLIPEHIERAQKDFPRENIEYITMDARRLDFPGGNFDVVVQRFSLHHMDEWEQTLNEILRVSSRHVLIEEPFDDLRSDCKRLTYQAYDFFLKLQHEVGFSHYHFIRPDLIIGCFERYNLPFKYELVRSDETMTFDEYFVTFNYFAQKSNRPDYWFGELKKLRREIGDRPLCHSDVLFISAAK